MSTRSDMAEQFGDDLLGAPPPGAYEERAREKAAAALDRDVDGDPVDALIDELVARDHAARELRSVIVGLRQELSDSQDEVRYLRSQLAESRRVMDEANATLAIVVGVGDAGDA